MVQDTLDNTVFQKGRNHQSNGFKNSHQIADPRHSERVVGNRHTTLCP